MRKRTIANIVASHPDPTTYVFLDTCAILDLLRLPAKYENRFNMLTEYKNLVEKANREEVILVASSMTYVELQSNKRSATQTEIDWENTLTKNLHCYEGFSKEAGLIVGNDISANYDVTDLITYLNHMYNDITRNILYFPEKLKYDRFALDRVANRIPPAMGKTEYKDCFIWNTCMDFANAVKATDRVLFFTTNKKDFVVEPRSPYANQFQRDAGNVEIFIDIIAMMREI